MKAALSSRLHFYLGFTIPRITF